MGVITGRRGGLRLSYALGLAAVLSLAPAIEGRAAAQVMASDRDAEGRALFDAAVAAYDAGRYADALRHFRAAYEASHRPELLYNIGQAADRLRRDDEAVEAFTQFLEAVPDSPRRAQIEARIAVLRSAPAGASDAPPTTVDDTPAGSAGSDALGPWMTTGAGLVLLAAGLPMMLCASSDAEAIRDAPDESRWEDYAGSYASIEPLSIAGQVLSIAGAVAAAAAITWWIVELTRSAAGGASARLELTPWGAQLRGMF